MRYDLYIEKDNYRNVINFLFRLNQFISNISSYVGEQNLENQFSIILIFDLGWPVH